jgi:hypothetical protein
MDRNIIAGGLAALGLCACASQPTDPVQTIEAQPPPYVVQECANVLAELKPLYEKEAESGAIDIRTGGLEGRGEVMGCNPRKYLPAQ